MKVDNPQKSAERLEQLSSSSLVVDNKDDDVIELVAKVMESIGDATAIAAEVDEKEYDQVRDWCVCERERGGRKREREVELGSSCFKKKRVR